MDDSNNKSNLINISKFILTITCYFCNKEDNNMKILEDGRNICNKCLKGVVKK